MITAVNMTNRNINNNTKGNVNFKGWGQLKEIEHYVLTPQIIDEFAKGGEDIGNKGLSGFWRVMSDMVEGSALKYYPKQADEGINQAFLKMRSTCLPLDQARETGNVTSVKGKKPWFDASTDGYIDSFKDELRRFLKFHGFIDDEGKFIGVPLKRVKIVGGEAKDLVAIPDNYDGYATHVQWVGGELFYPKFQNANIFAIADPKLQVEASGDVRLFSSTVGTIKGNEVYLMDSIVDGDVTANSLNLNSIKGDQVTRINGNAIVRGDVFCHSKANVDLAKDLFTPKISVSGGSWMNVNGQLGSKANKVKEIRVDGTLRTGAVYAENLPRVGKKGKFKPGSMHIDGADARQVVLSWLRLNPFQKSEY